MSFFKSTIVLFCLVFSWSAVYAEKPAPKEYELYKEIGSTNSGQKIHIEKVVQKDGYINVIIHASRSDFGATVMGTMKTKHLSVTARAALTVRYIVFDPQVVIKIKPNVRIDYHLYRYEHELKKYVYDSKLLWYKRQVVTPMPEPLYRQVQVYIDPLDCSGGETKAYIQFFDGWKKELVIRRTQLGQITERKITLYQDKRIDVEFLNADEVNEEKDAFDAKVERSELMLKPYRRAFGSYEVEVDHLDNFIQGEMKSGCTKNFVSVVLSIMELCEQQKYNKGVWIFIPEHLLASFMELLETNVHDYVKIEFGCAIIEPCDPEEEK